MASSILFQAAIGNKSNVFTRNQTWHTLNALSILYTHKRMQRVKENMSISIARNLFAIDFKTVAVRIYPLGISFHCDFERSHSTMWDFQTVHICADIFNDKQTHIISKENASNFPTTSTQVFFLKLFSPTIYIIFFFFVLCRK